MLQYTEFTQKITEAYTSLASSINDKERDEKECIDAFREVVKICIPFANGLMTNKDWSGLWGKYQQRAKDILQNPVARNNCYYFIDYALIFADNRSSEEDKLQVYKLFDAFDNTVQALNDIIQADDALIKKFQKRLDEKIKAAITDGPGKADSSNNSSFKNYVNEIAFFNHVANHHEIDLSEIETSLPNGKKADFQLSCGDKICLVDTMTIHNTTEQDDINRFVEGKVNDKFSSKTDGIEDDSILEQFRVLPIIELNDDRLLNYVPKLPKDKCFPPMISFIGEIEGENQIILLQLPLSEDIRNQLTSNNENN